MNNLQFTEERWQRVERDTIDWWNGELDRPLVYISVTDPVDQPRPYGYQSNYQLDLPAEAVADIYAPWLASTRFYGDAFPWFWINYGAGIVSGFTGGQVNSVTDPSETVWFNPPGDPIAIADLDLQFDPENVYWRRVQDLTRAFVQRFAGGRYGSGLQVAHTDLGGNLDIIASFTTTQQLLIDLIEQPEAVCRAAEQVTDLWLRYYDALDAIIRPANRAACRGTSAWTPIWSPGRTYMLQSDFAYMIGPKMFERFVLPDLTRICDHLDHGFYHLDGKGQIAHLDHLLSIERLRGIQWIPGDGQPSPDQWLPLLKRIRDGGKLCQVFVTPEGALRIARELGGKGFLFVIYGGAEFYHPEEVEAFLGKIYKERI